MRGTLDRASFEIVQLEGDPPPEEVERFLDREWAAFHRAAGHDMTFDWERRPVLFVCRDAAGEIAGVASGRISAGIGHLSELMVAEARRGQGIGGALLGAFEEYCEAAGCHKLTVHTDYDGAAHRYYNARGWRDEAILRRDRGRRDFVRLYKFIDD